METFLILAALVVVQLVLMQLSLLAQSIISLAESTPAANNTSAGNETTLALRGKLFFARDSFAERVNALFSCINVMK